MNEINRLSLYIINRIKLKRLIAGYSAYSFSLAIKKGENYVYNIENTDLSNKYNSADFPLIAHELGCSVHDLLPPDDWAVSDSHEKIDKVITSLSDPAFALEVIQGIASSAHAPVLATFESLAKHLNLQKEEEIKTVRKVWERFQSSL